MVAEQRGRHRYHRLADARVAAVVEGLAALAPRLPVRSLRESDRTAAERAARSCYDHLAGALGIAVTDGLCAAGALEPDSLGLRDPAPFVSIGVDVAALGGGRRPLTRSCLDWSERRPHLAGELGAAMLTAMLAQGWVTQRPAGRALSLTPRGRDGLRRSLALEL